MSVLPARRLVAGLIVLVAFAIPATSASAALDSKPPTKPGNLRVTAKTLTSVSMAWNASTDNSGNFSYRVRLWGDSTVVTLPKTQTSYTWTGLRPGRPVLLLGGGGRREREQIHERPARRRDGA